jgi:diguanylate cyclase (GGDEF)-like protein
MPTDKKLSEVLSEFAHTLLTDLPIQAILDHLVGRIVEVLPITSAGVSLIAPGASPEYVAASDDAALRYERLQAELGEGPCLAAFHNAVMISVPDLRDESRFPTFARRALEEGMAAVFTIPLLNGDECLGALDLYRDTPGPLSPSAVSAARTLADVTSVYLLSARAREDLEETSVQLREDSLHDSLTGLANRSLLAERLDHALRRSERTNLPPAIMYLDLDNFKQVNDQYGHSAGDELLIAVGERLRAALRPSDTVARLSGDEFVILCEDLSDTGMVERIASRVAVCLKSPFVLSTNEVTVTASVGTAVAVLGEASTARLLREADAAMYQAKRNGGARHQSLDRAAHAIDDPSAVLLDDLNDVTGRREMRNVYQPIVTVDRQCIVGVEALARWHHPLLGIIEPGRFIPLAEEQGAIVDIGAWVLQQACADRKEWRNSEAGAMTMSVNVSARQLFSAGYAATVEQTLRDSETAPELLTLELTETVFVEDSEGAAATLRDIRGLGVKIALDDFGTGFSSLSHLKRFPIDTIKIDRAFITGLGRDSASDEIVRAVIDLAHSLGMTVVAEGVECAAQHEELLGLGCDFCQGYFFARPMNADTVVELMRARRAVHA